MSVPSAYWIQTRTGVYDFRSAQISTKITLLDIAHPLSRIVRFGGHSRLRWTVAEHSMFVNEIGMQLLSSKEDQRIASPYLLLHDAHEAFVGDMCAPLKKYLAAIKGFNFKEIEAESDRRIRLDLRLPPSPPSWVNELISEADVYALKLERDAFMASKHEWVIDEVKIPSNLNVSLKGELPPNRLTRKFTREIEQAIRDYPHA
jgi:uncharacterized protein